MFEAKTSNFNLRQIAASGQCFRIREETPCEFSVVTRDKLLIVEYLGHGRHLFHCSKDEFESVWVDYFDLNTRYDYIIDEISAHGDKFVDAAIEYGSGIRILRQDLWEMIVSYLVARCKNIAGISLCIENMCRTYGKVIGAHKGKEYYSFPSPWAIAIRGIEPLLDCGLGFRAKDILNISELVVSGSFSLNHLLTASHSEAVEYLKKVHGIGDKVANCITLYGLHHVESVPEDVWIERIRDEEYKGESPWWYNSRYAGIIQQWVFYYRRTKGSDLLYASTIGK